VRKFIKLASDMIARKKAIAVHCKAGLGRTGCLIGAYLIYRHGFTANEVIAFMRFMRPGMVVGPQQHWLHMHQHTFREWYLEDQWKAKMESKPSTPRGLSTKTPLRKLSGTQQATPTRSSVQRSALSQIDGNDVTQAQVQDENLPAPTPGQPRKYARLNSRDQPYQRSTSNALRSPNKPEADMMAVDKQRRTSMIDSDEEYILQQLAARRSQSRSPHGKGKGRSVSYTTTTTTTTKTIDMGDNMGIYEDTEDLNLAQAMEDTNAVWNEETENQHSINNGMKLSTMSETRKTPRSASGMGGVSVNKTRSLRERDDKSPRRSGGEEKGRVRKTSGRVGSASYQAQALKR
jgi:cell division cycle 14